MNYSKHLNWCISNFKSNFSSAAALAKLWMTQCVKNILRIQNMKSTSWKHLSVVPTRTFFLKILPYLAFSVSHRWTQEEKSLFKGVKLILIKNFREDWSELSRWEIKEAIFKSYIAKPSQVVDMENDTFWTRIFHLRCISRRGDFAVSRAGKIVTLRCTWITSHWQFSKENKIMFREFL